jgi:EmrB/QacA subfamily drug resistance transporter
MTKTPDAPFSRAKILSILMGLLVAMLLGTLDQTIVATAMPSMGRDLGDVEQLPWVVTAYLLASVAVTPLYGKLADIHGRRPMMLIAIAIFIAGSILCALSPSVPLLAFSRAIQGAGGGGLISVTQTIIADIVPPRERGRYQGYIASVFVVSSLAGPVLGGFLSQHVHWSAIFWINLPLGALAYALCSSRLKLVPRHERPHRLDVSGALLLICASAPFLLALSWGGKRHAWTSVVILGLLAASALFAVLFAWRMRTAEEPLIPATVLGDQVVRTGTAAAALSLGAFVGLAIVMPVYLERVIGLTASQSGMALIPMMMGTVLGAMISGIGLAKVENYKLLPVIGLGAGCVATAVLAIWPAGLPFALMEFLLMLATTGVGTALPTSTVAVQNAVRVSELGAATSTSNFFCQVGGTLLAAVFGAIVFGQSGLQAGVPGAQAMALNAEEVAQLVGAFRWVFMAACLFIGLAFVAFAMMERRPLRSTPAGEEQTIVEAGR